MILLLKRHLKLLLFNDNNDVRGFTTGKCSVLPQHFHHKINVAVTVILLFFNIFCLRLCACGLIIIIIIIIIIHLLQVNITHLHSENSRKNGTHIITQLPLLAVVQLVQFVLATGQVVKVVIVKCMQNASTGHTVNHIIM